MARVRSSARPHRRVGSKHIRRHKDMDKEFYNFWKDSAFPTITWFDRREGFSVVSSHTDLMMTSVKAEIYKLNQLCEKYQLDACVMDKWIHCATDKMLKKLVKHYPQVLGITASSMAPEIGKKLRDYRFVFCFVLRQLDVYSQIKKFVNLVMVDRLKGIMFYYDPMYGDTVRAPRPIGRIGDAMAHRIWHTWHVFPHICNYSENLDRYHLYQCFLALVQGIRYGNLPLLPEDCTADYPATDISEGEDVDMPEEVAWEDLITLSKEELLEIAEPEDELHFLTIENTLHFAKIVDEEEGKDLPEPEKEVPEDVPQPQEDLPEAVPESTEQEFEPAASVENTDVSPVPPEGIPIVAIWSANRGADMPEDPEVYRLTVPKEEKEVAEIREEGHSQTGEESSEELEDVPLSTETLSSPVNAPGSPGPVDYLEAEAQEGDHSQTGGRDIEEFEAHSPDRLSPQPDTDAPTEEVGLQTEAIPEFPALKDFPKSPLLDEIPEKEELSELEGAIARSFEEQESLELELDRELSFDVTPEDLSVSFEELNAMVSENIPDPVSPMERPITPKTEPKTPLHTSLDKPMSKLDPFSEEEEDGSAPADESVFKVPHAPPPAAAATAGDTTEEYSEPSGAASDEFATSESCGEEESPEYKPGLSKFIVATSASESAMETDKPCSSSEAWELESPTESEYDSESSLSGADQLDEATVTPKEKKLAKKLHQRIPIPGLEPKVEILASEHSSGEESDWLKVFVSRTWERKQKRIEQKLKMRAKLDKQRKEQQAAYEADTEVDEPGPSSK